jgi:hypothetical protein
MAKCVHCVTDTELYVNGVPVCVGCDSKRTALPPATKRSLLNGERLKLVTPTTAVATVDGKHVAVTVPAGATIRKASGLHYEDGMINVLWEGRIIMMFAVDLEKRTQAIENAVLSNSRVSFNTRKSSES